MQTIKFKHQYFKLDNSDIFPTVRGKSNFNKLTPDSIVQIESPEYRFKALILSNRIWRIEDLSLSFIRIDSRYFGFYANDHYDFIDLLNSFRRFNKIKSIEEEVCVIWLQKLKT